MATLQEVEGVAREPGRPVDMGAGPGVPLERTPVGPPMRSGLPAAWAEPRDIWVCERSSEDVCCWSRAPGSARPPEGVSLAPDRKDARGKTWPLGERGPRVSAVPGGGPWQPRAGESRGGGQGTRGLRPAHPCWC